MADTDISKFAGYWIRSGPQEVRFRMEGEGIGGEDIEADTRYYTKPMQTYPTYDI